MLTLFSGSGQLGRDAFIQNVAKEVARRTRVELTAKVANLNVAELRGYLRARAAREAQELVRRSIAEVHLPRVNEAELAAAVLERAIHLVIRGLLTCPIAPIPTPHVQTRAA